MSFLTSQPGKGIYTLYAILYVLTTLPITLTKCAFFRSHPRWTFYQDLLNTLVKHFFDCCATIHMKTPQTLVPGAEKDRFTLIKPAAPSVYTGPCADGTIHPATIGGIWLPAPPTTTAIKTEKIILHLHGGAYVLLFPRETKVQWGPNTLLSTGLASHALLPDYRLSSNPGGRFPAPLQDAVSAYTHLLHDLSIPPSNIILSGDSAGGNLVLALLRYIAESPSSLPPPAAALLWSPWCDMGQTADELVRHRNYGSDYITPALLEWGVGAYVPADAVPSDPYFSPARHPFALTGATKLFVQYGSAEVLADEIVTTAEAMRKLNGGEGRVMLHESVDAMHDTFAGGGDIGFEKEALQAARAAREFVLA